LTTERRQNNRAMPSLVMFGAGNIGRGFIAPTFSAAGWSVTFVDIDRPRIQALAARGAYDVIEVDNSGERRIPVSPVTGIDAGDRDAVVRALAVCDLAATAVGLGALAHLAAPIAAGLRKRTRGALDILVCENGLQAVHYLRDGVSKALPDAERDTMLERLGLVRTSIGRMIPPNTGDDPLEIRVEPYATLPVERQAFKGPIPALPLLVAHDDFDLVLQQKLYLHNLTHACLAYAGHLLGKKTIPECMRDADLVHGARVAAAEVSEALAYEHGADPATQAAVREQCELLVDDLLQRYRNHALSDPVSRVARDPMRKLAPDDRLVGAARLCLKHDITPNAIVRHILYACAYHAQADEPSAEAWNRLRALGLSAQLAAVAHITPGDPLMLTVGTTERRLKAAKAMRDAGLVLRDEEVDTLEIADFGLGRFEEFGLAIHVYVNTTRCCAKELMMLPGQICPEHRHPPVDGEPGKEETFRCRQGEVNLFLPGHKKESGEREAALEFVPADKRDTVTVFKRIHLRPGDQCTLKPNTPHWFAAGPNGAVISEFSTRSRDEADVFTDPEIKRVPDPV
jgi:mannitol-1-phosphate 5-dehydrogenase